MTDSTASTSGDATDEQPRHWSFDADGALFRLVSEAYRIRLAHLADPLLAVHTSLVQPLPHQITAVYESMLPRQPLRFLLADDPGSGKTIMAGLLIKELIARGDLHRCLIVCPGSLAEQWQEEMEYRFQLPFAVYTSDKLQATNATNWFRDNQLVIARLDMLSRNEQVKELLQDPDCRWDLVVCDEAHKMSASYFGKKVKYTKRYRLGQLLSGMTRNFLLMTATPHNGKEEDFQLFMALLDSDRFAGRYRPGVHRPDTSDLMRRMVKEKLLKFDGTPLFPKRRAYTVKYQLSGTEAELYNAVTRYVRREFNRADKLDGKRKNTIGFALTLLQRRLASSPEAIYRSLRRRREKLTDRLDEIENQSQYLSAQASVPFSEPRLALSLEKLEDLEDAPENEAQEHEATLLDQATAAQSSAELRTEINTIKCLEELAYQLRNRGNDTKWRELAGLLDKMLAPGGLVPHSGKGEQSSCRPSQKLVIPSQKLVIFTEHKDTLNYLSDRIRTAIGRPEALVTIHGGVSRKDRLEVQEAFRHDPEVRVLLATDAACEGINLQRAHLMVNYDLPWNPNRIEQRFGRIHRIGQTEVCHLWNLVAEDTREGMVYRTLLDKLTTEAEALGGQVFDVLGQVQFDGLPLQDLLVRAIREGDLPEVRSYLTTVVDQALDRNRIQGLLEDHALVDHMDAGRLSEVREDMDRARARRLQPYFIESFFREAFDNLGGSLKERETSRFEVSWVPEAVQKRAREIGTREPVHRRYERVTFESSRVAPEGLTRAALICPGHPLLDSVLDLTLSDNRDLLKRGAVLVDKSDHGLEPRVLVYVESALEAHHPGTEGKPQTISKQLTFLNFRADGVRNHIRYAPYLDLRPLADNDPPAEEILARPECTWVNWHLQEQAEDYASENVVAAHLAQVHKEREKAVDRTEGAVRDRLTKEISYLDLRSQQLKVLEDEGRPDPQLTSHEASRQAAHLQERLWKRLSELEKARHILATPAVAIGGLLVVPKGLVDKMAGSPKDATTPPVDTQAIAAHARHIVMEVERRLGFEPVDREFDKLGYDIESRGKTGHMRFIEVKGRIEGAPSITVTRNEILFSLNNPENYILAIVQFPENETDKPSVHYLRQPFRREPDFGVDSSNYNLNQLLDRAGEPS